jgi:hypothetical protein
MRTYTIVKSDFGWELTLFNAGLWAGEGRGRPGDYPFLLARARSYCLSPLIFVPDGAAQRPISRRDIGQET